MAKGLKVNTTFVIYPLFAYEIAYCFGLVESSSFLTTSKWTINILLTINVILGLLTLFAISKIKNSKVKIESKVKSDKTWLMYVFMGLDALILSLIYSQGFTQEFSFIFVALPLKWAISILYKRNYSNVIKKGTLK